MKVSDLANHVFNKLYTRKEKRRPNISKEKKNQGRRKGHKNLVIHNTIGILLKEFICSPSIRV